MVVVLALVAGAMGPAGAAHMAQQCDGPAPTIQSGRATIAPGLNVLRLPQQIVLKITLFSCSPNNSTRGEGTLKTTMNIKAGQTCALLANPHTLRATATITWKDNFTSVLALTLALSGKSQNVHAYGESDPRAFQESFCERPVPRRGRRLAERGVAPSDRHRAGLHEPSWTENAGRVSISGLTFNTTKPFVIA